MFCFGVVSRRKIAGHRKIRVGTTQARTLQIQIMLGLVPVSNRPRTGISSRDSGDRWLGRRLCRLNQASVCVERQEWRGNGVDDMGGFGIIRDAALYALN